MSGAMIHTIASLAVVILAWLIGHFISGPVAGLWCLWVIAAWAVVFWPIREIRQARKKYRRWVFPGDPKWSRTKTREALYPAAAALVAALVITIIFR